MLKNISTVIFCCTLVASCESRLDSLTRKYKTDSVSNLTLTISPQRQSREGVMEFRVSLKNKTLEPICFVDSSPRGNIVGIQLFDAHRGLRLHESEASDQGIGGISDFEGSGDYFTYRQLEAGEEIDATTVVNAAWYDYFIDENLHRISDFTGVEDLVSVAVVEVGPCALKNSNVSIRMGGLWPQRSETSVPFKMR